MSITIVAALSRKDNAIGRNNEMLWHIPAELKHFKSVTIGKTIVMGRKTFESIGRPLPDRNTIVLTKDPSWHHDGVETITDYDDVVTLSEYQEIIIVGGGTLYEQFIDEADTMILSYVDGEYPDADTFFPEFDIEEDGWSVYRVDEYNEFDVIEYRR